MPSRRPVWRALMFTGWFIFGALVLAACSADPMSTLDTHGSHARNIYELLQPIFWFAVVVFVVVEGILIYSVFRFRNQPASQMPTQIHGNTTLEIAWTIAPAIIVLIIAVLTFRTQAINSRMNPDALKIHAIGQQWWFAFEYGDQEVVTANEMYIPVGRDVTVQLDSIDVLHNFWIPKLAGKTYMIPGNTNYISFRAENAGIYRGQCAEFCGEAHALMKFRVVAVEPEVFEKWLAAHKQAPAAPSSEPYKPAQAEVADTTQYVPEMPTMALADYTGGNAQAGLTVFNGKGNCYSCHIISGNEKAIGKVGPNLTYFGSRTTLAAGLLPNSSMHLAQWLHDPGMIKPGNIMSTVVKPGLLTDQEIKDLVAYLEEQKVDITLPDPR